MSKGLRDIVFVAVSNDDNPGMVRSIDACDNWEDTTPDISTYGSTGQLFAIAYGRGVFVTVSENAGSDTVVSISDDKGAT